jgi:hypothetical protein
MIELFGSGEFDFCRDILPLAPSKGGNDYD